MEIEKIVQLINNIGEYHKTFSKNFYKNNDSNINLKKTTIDKILKEISYNGLFMDLIDEYIKLISKEILVSEIRSNSSKFTIRFRGKNRESVLNKLYYYRFDREEFQIPIQKCLNDIMGFRIILESNLSYDELLEKIENSNLLKVQLFRQYVRKDENYHAIHIYLKSSSNIYLPWEVQIWKKEDEQVNESEHKNHKSKRKYINWIDMYKREE